MPVVKRVLSALVLLVLVAVVVPLTLGDVLEEVASEQVTAPAPAQVPSPSPEPTGSTTPASPEPVGESARAIDVLATLPVKGRAPKTGYDRDEFGKGWKDPDRNGCDARNDVLARDLTGVVHKPGTRGCVVLRGTLLDPYSGATIDFLRGPDTSPRVQIDHVVALHDAWQKGAQGLAADERVALGNDPLNLLAVDGSVNQAKGSGDAATWLPPRKDYRCAYVARQVAVKARHGLWVTGSERDAIARVLEGCPGERVPG